jgi:hypothetical protein
MSFTDYSKFGFDKPFKPKKTSPTSAETLNNTSGPGTSFSLGTYDEATNKYQGGLFDPDGFDYGAAFGSEPGKYVVTPNVIDTKGMSTGGDDGYDRYNQGLPYRRPADYSDFTPERARELMSSLAPTTRGSTGDYSDIDSFKSYSFGNPEYQFEDFKQLAEIGGYGKKNKLASDANILSGTGPDTYRQEGPTPIGFKDGLYLYEDGTTSDTSVDAVSPTTGSDPADYYTNIVEKMAPYMKQLQDGEITSDQFDEVYQQMRTNIQSDDFSTPITMTPTASTLDQPVQYNTPMPEQNAVVNQIVPPGGIQTLSPTVTAPTTYQSTSLLQPVTPLTAEQLAGLGTDSQQQIKTLIDALSLYEDSKNNTLPSDVDPVTGA